MHRFFIKKENIQNNEIIFPEEISHQIKRVLRLSSGDHVIALNNEGDEFHVQLQEINDKVVRASILEKSPVQNEPKIQLTLMVCLTQREKFELIMQKCTEIGVTCIQPVISSRSLVQNIDEVKSKYLRWHKIIQEAAEQSHRGLLPKFNEPVSFKQLVTLKDVNPDLKLILWEEETGKVIKQSLHGFTGSSVSLLVGPEGGFSHEEVALAVEGGFIPVSLGRRILRMETAAIISTGIVMYEFDL
jgi:16S rRNA (uracil1498-N3)-methyltransferase